jgi:hypothetical protein
MLLLSVGSLDILTLVSLVAVGVTLSVGAGSIVRPFRNARMRHFPEGASQSFKMGEPVILSTVSDKGNKVVIATTDPQVDLLGFAAGDASGVEDTKISVWVADEDAEFLIHALDAQTLDADDVGVNFGITKDATNVIWRLDRTKTTTTEQALRVLELRDEHGDINGRYVVRVLNVPRVYAGEQTS